MIALLIKEERNHCNKNEHYVANYFHSSCLFHTLVASINQENVLAANKQL